MRYWFRPRSRCFRIVLGMALLAWTAFAFDALAHPRMMSAAQTSPASVTMAGMTTPSDDMPAMAMSNTSHDPTPTQPIGNGHGCCQNAHCYCASFCSGVVGVSRIVVAFEPPHGPTRTSVGHGPVLARFTVLLRPPIA